MKKNYLLTLLMCISVSLSSQGLQKGTDSDKKLVQDVGMRQQNIDQVPYFVLRDAGNKYLLSISGTIKPIFGFDIGNVNNDINFIPSSLTVPAVRGYKSDYFANPYHSLLGFTGVLLPHTKDQISLSMHFMFENPESGVQIHYVYLKYRNFTLGRLSSLFSDDQAKPNTIDPQGPNGAVHVKNIRISYDRSFDSGLGFGISAEMPTYDETPKLYRGKDYPEFTDKDVCGDASQTVPDFPMYIQYRYSDWNRIRLSGIIRNFYYVDKIDNVTENCLGWGIQLSGNAQPIKPLIFYYQFAYGRGIANYIQDLNGLPLSYIPKDDYPGRLTASPMMGWFAGASYDFKNGMSLSYVYSQARVWENSIYAQDCDYKYGQYMCATVYYPIMKFLTFGFEWLWGRKMEWTGNHGHINRIQSTLKVTF